MLETDLDALQIGLRDWLRGRSSDLGDASGQLLAETVQWWRALLKSKMQPAGAKSVEVTVNR